MIALERAVEADDALEILPVAGHLEHRRSAEAVADGGDVLRMDALVLLELLERELPARAQQPGLLRGAGPFTRHLWIFGDEAIAVDVGGEGDVAEFGELLRAALDV